MAPQVAYDPRAQLASRLRCVHAVKCVGEDPKTKSFFVEVTDPGGLEADDVFLSPKMRAKAQRKSTRTRFAGRQVFKVIRQDTQTVSRLEATAAATLAVLAPPNQSLLLPAIAAPAKRVA